mmetsp:Transcript_106198/g.342590  ORF Transcript_106198/g.342590 Transcript_106198/m.342590 type:complete len:264 (+) Transcript_106198:131-922(+)
MHHRRVLQTPEQPFSSRQSLITARLGRVCKSRSLPALLLELPSSPALPDKGSGVGMEQGKPGRVGMPKILLSNAAAQSLHPHEAYHLFWSPCQVQNQSTIGFADHLPSASHLLSPIFGMRANILPEGRAAHLRPIGRTSGGPCSSHQQLLRRRKCLPRAGRVPCRRPRDASDGDAAGTPAPTARIACRPPACERADPGRPGDLHSPRVPQATLRSTAAKKPSRPPSTGGKQPEKAAGRLCMPSSASAQCSCSSFSSWSKEHVL